MRPTTNPKGYKLVFLTGYRNKHCGWFMIHRLVCSHFGEISEGECFDVNHIDMNPANNHIDNLEYCTHQQNIIKARLINNWKSGRKPGFKLSDKTKAKMAVKKYKKVKAIKGTETLYFDSIENLINHFGIYRKKFNRLVNSYKDLNGYLLRYCKS